MIEFCERPFANTEQIDQVLLANLCDRVGPEDDLWIVVDFACVPRAKRQRYLDEIFEQLPGARMHLVAGKHDLEPTLDLPWNRVGPLLESRDGPKNQLNTLCHYPMITWNHARRSALQLIGHAQNNWMGSRNLVNVGVDMWDFAPVCSEEVEGRSKTLAPNLHWEDVEPER